MIQIQTDSNYMCVVFFESLETCFEHISASVLWLCSDCGGGHLRQRQCSELLARQEPQPAVAPCGWRWLPAACCEQLRKRMEHCFGGLRGVGMPWRRSSGSGGGARPPLEAEAQRGPRTLPVGVKALSTHVLRSPAVSLSLPAPPAQAGHTAKTKHSA